MRSKKAPLSWLDLRICLVLMIFISIVALMLQSEQALLILFLLLCVWLCLFGLPKQMVTCLIWYFVLWGSLYVLRDIPVLGTTSLPLVTVYVRRLMLPVMAARPLQAASNGRLIASLNRLHFPKAASLSLSVLFRFLPTISEEYRHIKSSQKFRGIGVTFWSTLLHPLEIVEYTMIPMLIRTSKTADELSASAAVRGMRLKGKVSSYYKIKTCWGDWFILGVGIILVVTVFLFDRIGIGG